MRRKSTWTEIAAPSPGCYYRVRCNRCQWETVKASQHNAKLAQVSHMGSHHFGHAYDFTVLPMARTELPSPQREEAAK